MNVRSIALLILSSLLLTQCEWNKHKDTPKPQPQLPEATQEGKNTFGCFVNGEVWLTGSGDFFIGPILYADYSTDLLFVKANRKISIADSVIDQSIDFAITGDIKPGVFQLKRPHDLATFADLAGGCWYETDSVYAGKMEITKLDQTKHIVAGKFEFTVFLTDCDTIRVTEGRFDLQY